MSGVADPRVLEARSERDEHGKLRPRDFFWDSIVLYVVGVIIGLTAIDVVTEYIRGSAVECFSPNGTDVANVSDLVLVNNIYRYINNFCSSSLPITQFFTAFIVVHGILIAAPHYLWLNHFGGSLNYFFNLVSLLERLKNDKSGKYPNEPNVIIVRQLEAAFTTYKRNRIFWFYVLKLILQWLLSIAGLDITVVYFTDFNPTFQCPHSIHETTDEDWPIPGQQVTCVFKSLRLLEVIRTTDIILLCIVVLGLTWSLLWVVSSHANELGYKDVAIFSFQSGLDPKYFVPNSPVPRCCLTLLGIQCVMYKVYTLLPWLYGPRISDDMGFLMMMLFRADGGLGHVMREIQIQKEVQNLDDGELRILNLHIREQSSTIIGDLIEKSDDGDLDVLDDLKWKFDKGPADRYRNGVYNQWKEIRVKDSLDFPDSFRGAVLGFSSLAHRNDGALYVSFSSPTVGIPTALRRVFSRVGCIKFSPFYRNSDPSKKVILEQSHNGVVTVLCPDDILTGEQYSELLDEGSAALEIWKPGVLVDTFTLANLRRTDFIVIGPLNSTLQKTTVTLLLNLLKGYLSKEVIILYIYPLKLSGKDVRKDFKPYTPPRKYFCGFERKLRINIDRKSKELPWPTPLQPNNDQLESTGSTKAATPSAASELPHVEHPSVQDQPEQETSSVLLSLVEDKSQSTSIGTRCTSNEPVELSVLVGDKSHSLFRFTLSQWERPTGSTQGGQGLAVVQFKV